MINIGTNFNYQGQRFLDERQNVSELSELLNWSTPIPEGFEVCVNNVWYVYDSSLEFDLETGYFRKRLDYEYPGSIVEENIEVIEREINPLVFSSFTSNEGIFEVGSQVDVSISWSINREEPFEVEINNTPLPQSSTQYSISITSNIVADIPYTIKITKGEETIEKTITYSFRFKKFWGTDEENLEEEFCESWKMKTKIFDCTGGKNALYIIPSEYYSDSEFSMYTGGMYSSDYEVEDIDITRNNLTKPYKKITKTTPGTSKLNIKFDD